MQTEEHSRGQSESFNLNTQRLGRELMTPAELAKMPGDKCILQLRGLPPMKDINPDELYTVYEVDVSDEHMKEDEDILNYDDLDDPDDFV